MVAITLIIATMFMGVLPIEKPAIQTGQSIPESNVTEQQGDSVLQFDGTVSQESDAVESNSVLPVGVGGTTNVQVRPGYRYYTVEELRKGLLYELEPLAPYFIQAQEDYGIDAVFLAAIAAEESGWGRHRFRKNNIFGFENCDFDSWEQCIDHAAKWIKTQYLTPGGLYYEGVGVTDINVHYNSRKEWEYHIIAIMGQIVDRVERTKTK